MPPATPTLPAGSLALARSRAYDLFGRLFLQGPAQDNFPLIEAIPELAEAITRLNDSGQRDFDRLAADHYTLFGLNVFPYESIFLDAEGNLGGPISGEVLAFYRQAGFEADFAGENPDHIGLEFELLAFLSAAEADAWEDGLDSVARRMRDLQQHFLDAHLLRWLPALAQAIRQQGDSFYSVLASLTIELALEHRLSLFERPAHPLRGFELPPAPDILENEKTGLKEIARFLLIPAYSGLYLSREDVSRLASRLAIPRGFGSREQMLSNLLHTAVDYEKLPLLLESLISLTGVWAGFYETFSREQQAFAPFVTPWLGRLHSVQALLSTLSSQVK